uniref:Uncharacterized protein n=1 Tax=Macaca fascicularis TaxID=9541 RepID=A0A7N9CUJ0_MACFA
MPLIAPLSHDSSPCTLSYPSSSSPSQPPTKHSPTYQTRMILPICIHNPTIYPQQTGRRTSTIPINPHLNSHPHTSQIQTTKYNIPPTQPIPILTPNHNPTDPYLNWKPTDNPTPHHYWPSNVHNILHYNSNPNTTSFPN